MATVRANLAQLYTPIYDKFMLAAYAEETMVHNKVFDVIVDPTKEWKYDDVSAASRTLRPVPVPPTCVPIVSVFAVVVQSKTPRS